MTSIHVLIICIIIYFLSLQMLNLQLGVSIVNMSLFLVSLGNQYTQGIYCSLQIFKFPQIIT